MKEYAGLDIHTEKLYGTVLDKRGDIVVRGSLPYTKAAIQSFFAEKKTDKVDSRILADLLRTGYLPEVYIPSEDVLKLRDIARLVRIPGIGKFSSLTGSSGGRDSRLLADQLQERC
ncbi:MAG: hypothetical protein LRZ87_02255 [Methanocellales archaeon]|nr:hypothetical protein [Methanocellales archaeon]